jgi:hypothetical protein
MDDMTGSVVGSGEDPRDWKLPLRVPMSDDVWASLADQFVDGAYASVKGQVRTYVLHQQLMEHLTEPPGAVLDVGGGGGTSVVPVQARGEDAVEATGGRRFAAVLCHGVLMYVDDPSPLITSLSRCAAPGGIVSVMALNAKTLAVRPALERRWVDALAAFETSGEHGVLGVETRADTVEGRSRAKA